MSLDFTKPLLSDGHPVRILCTDGPGGFPVIGIWLDMVCRWTLEGGPLTGCIGVHNLTQAPEPAKLQLREGGYYRSKSGIIEGPMSPSGCSDKPWGSVSGNLYRNDGGALSDEDSGFDLISEVTVTDVPLQSPGGIDAVTRPDDSNAAGIDGQASTTAPIPPPSPDYPLLLEKHLSAARDRIAELTKINAAGSAQVEAMRKHIAELTKPQPQPQPPFSYTRDALMRMSHEALAEKALDIQAVLRGVLARPEQVKIDEWITAQSQKQCAGWVNVYEDGCSNVHRSREQADTGYIGTRIACVPVQYLPGEGIGNSNGG